jgi:O-antigen/teichoic acid export membrane protein
MFVITFLSLIGESGLGAALIRKPGELSKKELACVFTFQQIIMGGVSIAFLFVTFFLKNFLKNPDVLILFQVSIISYFLLSFRNIPFMLLQRNLFFGKISFLEIVETLSFQGTAIILAMLGKGVWALIFGLMAKNIVSLFLLFIISPWKIEYNFDFETVKNFLPFGISIQTIHFINLIKDSTIPVWVGAILGTASVGLITWATTIANYPVLASNIVSRILFPLFAKLQNDKERLKSTIELVLRINVFFIFGLSAILWGGAEPITIILYTDKWVPALVLFNFFIPINLLTSLISPLIYLNNALGNAKYNLKFSILWALLLWLFSIIFVPKMGIIGFGLANLLTTMVNIKYLYDAIKNYNINIIKDVTTSLLVSFIIAFSLKLFLKYYHIQNLWILIFISILSFILYVFFSFILNYKTYFNDIKFIQEKVFKGQHS